MPQSNYQEPIEKEDLDLKKKLSGVIEKLRKQMKEHFEVNKIEIGSYTDLDVKDFNAFYHFKSKTILLFDFLGLPKLRF